MNCAKEDAEVGYELEREQGQAVRIRAGGRRLCDGGNIRRRSAKIESGRGGGSRAGR